MARIIPTEGDLFRELSYSSVFREGGRDFRLDVSHFGGIYSVSELKRVIFEKPVLLSVRAGDQRI